MSSSIRFKFKSNLKFDSILFDGSSIKVKDLKNAIRQKSHLTSNDYDIKLEDTNGKVFLNDNDFVPRYTSVIASRIPKLSTDNQQRKKILNPEDLSKRDAYKNRAEDPKFFHLLSSTNILSANMTEEEKIKLMIERSTEQFDEKHFPVKAKPYGRPPTTYVCNKCRKGGHWIHECPGVRDKDGRLVDPKTIKRPTGIPQAHLLEVEAGTPGAYLDHNGKYMVPINDAEAYAAGKKEKRPFSLEENPPYIAPTEEKPPADLLCPLCHELYKEAVSTRCCKKAYCLHCIMNYAFDASSGGGHHKCPNCGEPIKNNETDLLPCVYMRELVKQWRTNPESLRMLFQVESDEISQPPTASTSVASPIPVALSESIPCKQENSPIPSSMMMLENEMAAEKVGMKEECVGEENKEALDFKEPPITTIRRVLKPKPKPEPTKVHLPTATLPEVVVKIESIGASVTSSSVLEKAEEKPIISEKPESFLQLTVPKAVDVKKEEMSPKFKEELESSTPPAAVAPQQEAIPSAKPSITISAPLPEVVKSTEPVVFSEIKPIPSSVSSMSLSSTTMPTTSLCVPPQHPMSFAPGPSHTSSSLPTPYLPSNLPNPSSAMFSQNYFPGISGAPMNVATSGFEPLLAPVGNLYGGGGGGASMGVDPNYQHFLNVWNMSMQQQFPQVSHHTVPQFPVQPVNNNDAAIAAFLAACQSGGATGVINPTRDLPPHDSTTLTREEFYAIQKLKRRHEKRYRSESRSPSPYDRHRKYSRLQPVKERRRYEREERRDHHSRHYISSSRHRRNRSPSPISSRHSREVEQRRAKRHLDDSEVALIKQSHKTSDKSSHSSSVKKREPLSPTVESVKPLIEETKVVSKDANFLSLEEELGPEPEIDVFGNLPGVEVAGKKESHPTEEPKRLKRSHKEKEHKKKSKHKKKKHKKNKKKKTSSVGEPSDSGDNAELASDGT